MNVMLKELIWIKISMQQILQHITYIRNAIHPLNLSPTISILDVKIKKE